MNNYILFRCVLFILFWTISPLAAVEKVTSKAFQQFVKEYHDSDRTIAGSELAYAIEKDYDAMALFYLHNFPLGQIDYFGATNKRNYEIYCYNIFCRCVMKNKLDLLKEICRIYPDVKLDGSEYFRYQDGLRYQERRILNMAIEERENSLEWVKLIAHFGGYLHSVERYYLYNQGGRGTHVRTPIEAAILLNKLDVVEYLLEKNIPPSTGLLTAVKCRNKEAVILLLNYGVDPYPALYEAIQLGYDEIADLLSDVYFSTTDRV